MRKVRINLVPKNLSDEQKEDRFSISQLLGRNNRQPTTEPNFMHNVRTDDKPWVLEYDPEIKRQSAEWDTPTLPRPMKARMGESKGRERMDGPSYPTSFPSPELLRRFFTMFSLFNAHREAPNRRVSGENEREIIDERTETAYASTISEILSLSRT
ncbi:hypothetical protein Trydic_g3083 [Trypoxylus dichotomus]